MAAFEIDFYRGRCRFEVLEYRGYWSGGLVEDDAILGFDDDGDGTVIEEFDVHHGAELSELDVDAGGFEGGTEVLVKAFGIGWVHGFDEGGAISMACLSA